MSTSDMVALEARCGAALVRRMANAQARVLDFTFDVVQTPVAAMPGLEMLRAASLLVDVVALRSDVDAAPVDLNDGDAIAIDGVRHIVVSREDFELLGQVQFRLDPRP
jgi:hypothetical protein